MGAKKEYKKGIHKWTPDKWWEYFKYKFRNARKKYFKRKTDYNQ